MASELRVNTLKDASGNNSVALSTVAEGSAKAWAHFDGTASSDHLNDSFNFSSVTDNSTGNYNPNLTNNMSSVSYSCAGSSNMTSSNRGAFRALTYTTSTVNIVIYGNGSVVDASDVSVNFHGDLA